MLSRSHQQITQILHRQLCRDVFFDLLTEVTKPLTKDIFGFVTFHFQQNKSHFYRLELDLRKLSDMNFFRILLIRVFCDCNCPLGPFCPLLFLPSFDFFLKSSGLVSKICDRSLSSTWTGSMLGHASFSSGQATGVQNELNYLGIRIMNNRFGQKYVGNIRTRS